MYIFEEMVDLCDQEWKSPAHRKVAVALLIGNPLVGTRQQLVDYGVALNGLTEDEVKLLTVEDAKKLGIPVSGDSEEAPRA